MFQLYRYGARFNMDALHEKYNKLKEYLSGLGSIVIAFSSGVDSTFLLKTAKDVLGDNVLAVTARSCSFPKRELNEAQCFCVDEKIKHIVIDSEELSIEGFRQNPKNRCYLCKHELFSKIIEIADKLGYKHIAEGSNMDDIRDFRPGLRAIEELGIKSPLRYAELTKNEIRALSKEIGLSTWNKQSFACLSSRFVYGETITEDKLVMVDKAEQFLLDKGFHQVRVRVHGSIARIEILPTEFSKLIVDSVRNEVNKALKELGFTYVTMDLAGYRTGSMNDTIL